MKDKTREENKSNISMFIFHGKSVTNLLVFWSKPKDSYLWSLCPQGAFCHHWPLAPWSLPSQWKSTLMSVTVLWSSSMCKRGTRVVRLTLHCAHLTALFPLDDTPWHARGSYGRNRRAHAPGFSPPSLLSADTCPILDGSSLCSSDETFHHWLLLPSAFTCASTALHTDNTAVTLRAGARTPFWTTG